MTLDDVPPGREEERAAAKAEATKGLVKYYASLTASVLARYDLLLHLLGHTSDWTAPGAACEELVADVLRGALPGRFSVDKGFVWGRRVVESGTEHCPEVDLIVHDTCDYSPICRSAGFVVVHPAAVRAIIQVKRTATSDQIGSGIINVIDAKTHLCQSDLAGVAFPFEKIFTAVVTLGSSLEPTSGGLSNTFETKLKAGLAHCRNLASMPHFVGCLGGTVLTRGSERVDGSIEYTACNASYRGSDGSLQLGFALLIGLMRNVIWGPGRGPLVSLPDDVPITGTVVLTCPP